MILLAHCSGSRPENLGLKDGRFAPCPDKPNCVSTFASDEEHKIEPISFTGSAAEAKARLKAVLAKMSRAHIVSEKENYLHVEFTSLIWRFVDDVQFYIDDNAKLIHFKSASRIGHSDLGANRNRMEKIRKLFVANN